MKQATCAQVPCNYCGTNEILIITNYRTETKWIICRYCGVQDLISENRYLFEGAINEEFALEEMHNYLDFKNYEIYENHQLYRIFKHHLKILENKK